MNIINLANSSFFFFFFEWPTLLFSRKEQAGKIVEYLGFPTIVTFSFLYQMQNACDLIQVRCHCLALICYAYFKVFATHFI